MFRIEKSLVQEASPADIPLIPIRQLATSPAPAVKLKAVELQEDMPPEARGKVEVILQQARREADSIIDQAQQQAQATREEAQAKLAAADEEAEASRVAVRQEAQEIRERARQEGYQEGNQQGLQEGERQGLALYRQQAEEASQDLQRLFAELAEAREIYCDSFETDMVNLAFRIAEKIVITTIDRDDTVFMAMITNALKQMRRQGKITVRVSERQYNEYFKAESAYFVLGDESVNVTMVNDPLLQEGDVILESDGETVNAGVASQLKHISLAFGSAGGGER